MEAAFKSSGITNSSNSAVQNPGTPGPDLIPTSAQESKDVMLAGKEIDRALSKIEEGCYEEAVEICEDLHAKVTNKCSQFDVRNIKDKIFEAAIQVLLFGNKEIAIRILNIADSSGLPDTPCIPGRFYHHEANACRESLRISVTWSSPHYLTTTLEKAISTKEHLKCTPLFLAIIYGKGLYSVIENEKKAKKYLQIAADRGYEPLSFMKKQGEEYKLMLAAQQENESVFSGVPRELIDHIARLRVEATVAQNEARKKT